MQVGTVIRQAPAAEQNSYCTSRSRRLNPCAVNCAKHAGGCHRSYSRHLMPAPLGQIRRWRCCDQLPAAGRVLLVLPRLRNPCQHQRSREATHATVFQPPLLGDGLFDDLHPECHHVSLPQQLEAAAPSPPATRTSSSRGHRQVRTLVDDIFNLESATLAFFYTVPVTLAFVLLCHCHVFRV